MNLKIKNPQPSYTVTLTASEVRQAVHNWVVNEWRNTGRFVHEGVSHPHLGQIRVHAFTRRHCVEFGNGDELATMEVSW